MIGYPGGNPAAKPRTGGINNGDITGSVAAKPAEKKEEPKKEVVPPEPESIAAPRHRGRHGTAAPGVGPPSALCWSDCRSGAGARCPGRELDLRESLIKAAEKKLETQAASQEAEKSSPTGQRKEDDNARFKGVVIMYEAMKPKDAAKIFDRLDPKVLIEVASQIKPQRMSEIMAQMSPEAAERLTVEMATRGRPTAP